MNDLLSDFEAFEAEQKQRSEQSYDNRMLKRLLTKTAYDPDVLVTTIREAGDEFGFEWFNETFDPPLLMRTDKVKNASFEQFLAGRLMRKPVGEAFLRMRAEVVPEKPVGVIFPVKNHSNWIIHDSLNIPVIPGVSHVVRVGRDDAQLRIIPFDSFAEGLKQVWQP